MKSLRKYITESVRTYDYTIKIAGEVDKNFLDLFALNLRQKFDAIDIAKPISTPIQKSPYGFPNLENQSVTIIKANFRYPATEPMIQQMAQLLGYNVNMVRVIGTSFDDSINTETEQYANQSKENPLLSHEQMADNGKEANKAYGESYLSLIKDQSKDEQIEVNSPTQTKNAPEAFDPFKVIKQDPKGADSPMSKITRPAKPKTGASFNK